MEKVGSKTLEGSACPALAKHKCPLPHPGSPWGDRPSKEAKAAASINLAAARDVKPQAGKAAAGM